MVSARIPVSVREMEFSANQAAQDLVYVTEFFSSPSFIQKVLFHVRN